MTPFVRRNALALVALGLVVLPALYSGTSGSHAGGGPDPAIIDSHSLSAPGSATAAQQISVRFKPGASAAGINSLNSRQGAQILERQARSGINRIQLPEGASVEQALAAYRSSPIVAEANVTHIAQLFEHPNDTNYPYQWHLRSTPGGMWSDTAWDLAPNRGQGVVVAVIDTGVAYEDFNGSLNGNPQTFKIAPDLASTPFVAPWDFNNNDAHPNDDHGHGSHVAGTVSQDTNNAYGVAGVASNSTIMPLKVLDYTGNGFDPDIVDAIYHAVDNGADVINMSLGFPGTGAPDGNGVTCTEILGLNAALDYAYNNGRQRRRHRLLSRRAPARHLRRGHSLRRPGHLVFQQRLGAGHHSARRRPPRRPERRRLHRRRAAGEFLLRRLDPSAHQRLRFLLQRVPGGNVHGFATCGGDGRPAPR